MCTREAVGGKLLQRLVDGGLHMRRHRLAPQRHPAGLLRHHRCKDRLRRTPDVRRIARQQLVRDTRERVHVTPCVQLPISRCLLGAHVVRCAKGQPGFGQPRSTGLTHRQRDPEVRHQRLTRLQQDVLRLDVAVNDAALVREAQRPRHRLRDLECLLHRKLLLPIQLVAQGLALDVGHDVVQERVGHAGIVERQDVGMLQVGGDFNFDQKSLGADDGGEFGP